MVQIELNEVQLRALEMMDVKDIDEMAAAAVASAIKSKMNYYVNGASVKTREESTHSVVRNLSSGKQKTIYYKGGLRGSLESIANTVADVLKAAGIGRADFINGKMTEANEVLSALSAKNEDSDESEE